VSAESAPATEPLEDYADSVVYRWVIRGLYVTAVGLNIWILYQASADDVEMAILRARARAWLEHLARPFTTERAWRRAVNRMHYAAAEAIEGAAVPTGEDPDAA
jgi:hypothetical protein